MFLFWNIRGLNDPRRQRSLVKSLKKFQVNIISLLETHVLQNNFSSIVNFILPGWSSVTNYEFATLGRIWILFYDTIRLDVFMKVDQAIHCHIYSKSLKKHFFLSVVYGANSAIERRKLWSDLVAVKSCMGEAPWLVCGDFNFELFMTERSDYFEGMPYSQSSLDFRRCLEEVEHVDMRSDGPYFTWSNKRVQGFLAKN